MQPQLKLVAGEAAPAQALPPAAPADDAMLLDAYSEAVEGDTRSTAPTTASE